MPRQTLILCPNVATDSAVTILFLQKLSDFQKNLMGKWGPFSVTGTIEHRVLGSSVNCHFPIENLRKSLNVRIKLWLVLKLWHLRV